MKTPSNALPAIDTGALKTLLDEDKAVLIDVREDMEYAREHIAGARHFPLSRFDPAEFAGDSGKIAVFCCASGNRTTANADRLAATGLNDVRQLSGGIAAWKAAGLPIVLNRKAPIDILRQVQIGAGSMIVAGAVLGAFVSPWFIALSGFVGVGLLSAGITGKCGMAEVLTLMPWNRAAAGGSPKAA